MLLILSKSVDKSRWKRFT